MTPTVLFRWIAESCNMSSAWFRGAATFSPPDASWSSEVDIAGSVGSWFWAAPEMPANDPCSQTAAGKEILRFAFSRQRYFHQIANAVYLLLMKIFSSPGFRFCTLRRGVDCFSLSLPIMTVFGCIFLILSLTQPVRSIILNKKPLVINIIHLTEHYFNPSIPKKVHLLPFCGSCVVKNREERKNEMIIQSLKLSMPLAKHVYLRI